MHEANALRKAVIKATTNWGYFKWYDFWKKKFIKNKRVLDIGMGQGPYGVVALTSGVKEYTGVDPALCINVKAQTRNKKLESRTGGNKSCTSEKCMLLNNRYGPFPFTGIEMMQAFPGRMALVPGTFPTTEHTDVIVPGAYDVVTMTTVTEHLQDLHGVLRGVYDHLIPKNGQLNSNKIFYFNHGPYYAYSGHHTVPGSPADYNAHPEDNTSRMCGQWKHLESNCSAFIDPTMNRIRLGDFVALVHAYFEDCKWMYLIQAGTPQALTSQQLKDLQMRHFELAELLVQHLYGTCKRRATLGDMEWMKQAIFYHPPTDGSYHPQPLPKSFQDAFMNVSQIILENNITEDARIGFRDGD